MIDEYAETHNDDEDVFLLDKEVVTKLLADSEISEEKLQRSKSLWMRHLARNRLQQRM